MNAGSTFLWVGALLFALSGAMMLNAGGDAVASLEDGLGPSVDVRPL